MKITLFFCAGNYAETLGIHKVSEMDGAGRRMPLTTLAFSIGALGRWGTAHCRGGQQGLADRWATAAGMAWAIPVLWASSLLNAAYFRLSCGEPGSGRLRPPGPRSTSPARLARNGLVAAAAAPAHGGGNAGCCGWHGPMPPVPAGLGPPDRGAGIPRLETP